MTPETSTLVDAFDTSALDEEVELSALARAIELAEGFSLLLVRCNQAPQRERLMAEVRARLPRRNIQTIHFSKPVVHLLDALREQLSSPLPDAVFVSGLEHSVSSVAEVNVAPFIANLNTSRNSFPQAVPCPLALWVPEYVLTAIAQGAPDFFSIRSGAYFFAAEPSKIANLALNLAAGKEWEVLNLTRAEKEERVAAIKGLLAEYKLLPESHRDQRTEGILVYRQGTLFYSQGNYVEALKQYQRSLTIFEELGDRANVAGSLHQIGLVLETRGDYDTALEQYQRSLKIFEELRDRAGVAGSLGQIGMIYQLRGDYDAALQQYQRSLKIFEELGDRESVAASRGQIGMIHQLRGDYDAALQHYHRSLKAFEEFGDHVGIASSLHQIGTIHQERGDYDAALQQYQRSLKLFEELGDQDSIAISHGQIGKLFTETGRYAEAFENIISAFSAFIKLQSPHARTAINVLKTLRFKWGEREFDAVWQEATGESLPDWLNEAEAV